VHLHFQFLRLLARPDIEFTLADVGGIVIRTERETCNVKECDSESILTYVFVIRTEYRERDVERL